MRSAVLLSLIIEKCKKCLDFTVTLFFVHLLVCTIYEVRARAPLRDSWRTRRRDHAVRRASQQIPSTWDWWIVHGISLIIMTVLGACVSRGRVVCVPHRIHQTAVARVAFCARGVVLSQASTCAPGGSSRRSHSLRNEEH